MPCPRCGFVNIETATRCAKCGAALTGPAPDPSSADAIALRRELTETQEAVRRLRRYVPSVVAEGILHDQERLRGESREVTVLFADAVSFTHLSASLGAESIFNLINDLLSRLVECVHRYDGMVDKFTGDGLMAVFGAPGAHENDAELAVRAALDMQKAALEFESIARAQLGAPLQIRIGVHSGPVVAGILGTQEQAAYTVIGETVNLASRLQAQARPACILVSYRIYQQTQALFNFQTAGTLQIKGIDQPVAVYEALGDRSEPLSTRGISGVSSIYLGHDTELQQLRALLSAFLDDRRGRLIVIQGEAGLGKSRMVQEWLSTSAPGPAAIWKGRGLPYTQGVSYSLFRSLLHDALREQPGEGWDVRVSPALRPFLRQMLGMALTPDERIAFSNLEPDRVKLLTTLALREWVLGEARLRPLILILDDFHWSDDLSRDMLQSIANLVNEVPIVLCIMMRPQPEKPLMLPALTADKSLAAPLKLSLEVRPLSAKHSRALLGHLVNLSDLPEPITNTILIRSEGNPFYIEEFVRILIEKEVLRLQGGQWRVASAMALQTVEIPTTLNGLMMTRIDRLPKELQQVLRSASVLGLQFPARVLDEMERRLHGIPSARPMVERLIDMGVLEERQETGELLYTFCHILTQETIYNSLLHSQQPELHRIIAESIESLYADNLLDQAEVLALHFDRARARDKALQYAVLAGDRARARLAHHEAIEYYSRALQISQHLSGFEAARWQAAVGLGEVQQLIGEYQEAIAFYQAALEEWSEASPEDRGRTMLKLGQVWDKRGNLQETENWLRQALAQVDQAQAALPDLRAQIYSELGWLNLRQGDLTSAQEWLEKGLGLVGDTLYYGVLSSILNRLGAIHYNRSEWKQAAEYVKRALDLRERLGDVVGYARSLNNLAILKQSTGDWEGALSDYQHVVEMQERIGEVEGLVQACTNLGVLYTERGEWAKADDNLQRSFALAQQIAHPYELAQAHMNLGRLDLLQERWADSARHLNSSIALYGEVGARANLNLNDVYYLQGILNLEQGRVDETALWAKRSRELLTKVTETDHGESVEWGRYELLLGRIAMARHDLTEARHQIDRSVAIFEANGVEIESGRAAYWNGLLSQELSQIERAREELGTARQIFDQLGAVADSRRTEAQLARLSPPA
jgi:class 3 adenylate cyclase/tetratricopeptide (TPR) repeat protein